VHWPPMSKKPQERDARPALPTERHTAGERLDELTELLIRLDAAREHERQKLAEQLHSKVVSSLSAVKMECDWLVRARKADEETVRRMARVCDTLAETIQFTRRVIDQLWPAIVEHLGLAAAVKQQIADFQSRTKAEVRADVDDDVDRVPQGHAITLYRLVQQTLLHYTESDPPPQLALTLRRMNGGIELGVEDLTAQGRALAAMSSDSDALALIEERVQRLGGQFEIRNATRGGMRVYVSLPLSGQSA
jgi:signal transduction histidine kinase